MVLMGLFLVSPVMADTFLGTSGGGWADMPTPDQQAPPFWDNQSSDPQPPNYGNVGQYLLTGYGGFPAATGQYWSIGGLVDNNVTFNGVKGGQTESLLIEVAGNAGSNELYAYNVANPHERILIFDGSATAGATVQKNITFSQYGFLLVGNGGSFFSGSGHGEVSSDATSNFAFFQNPALSGVWWIGIEDLTTAATGKEGFGDFQDMIIKVSTVPIPPTALLLGSGLLGLGILVGRRRNKA